MNMTLIKHGYTVAVVPREERDQYINTLELADKSEDLAQFIAYIAHCCEYTLNLHLKAARGEDIEDAEDIDKEIELFLQKSTSDTNRSTNICGSSVVSIFLLLQRKDREVFQVIWRS